MAESVKVTVLMEGDEHPQLKGSSGGPKVRPLVGLSLFIEVTGGGRTRRILMDTGTLWRRLRHNASVLGLDFDRLDCGFITHWHFDHTGALPALVRHMTTRPPFFVPEAEPSFSPINGFVEWRLPAEMNRVEVSDPREILPDVYSTGCLARDFPLQHHPVHEQALYIPVDGQGLVLLVGCSHPKPQDLANRALELSGADRIALMLGGFHFIPPTKEPEKDAIVAALRDLPVERIAACHCTGAEGMERLGREFPDRYEPVRLGGVFEVGPIGNS